MRFWHRGGSHSECEPGLLAMNIETYPRLLGDVGGTNARFAWQTSSGALPTDVATYAGADHGSLLEAMRHYLAEHHKPVPACCAIGIANPVTGDSVQMTNHHWSFSVSSLQRDLGLERLVVINDFTALALSLPALGPADLRPIGTGVAVPLQALAVLGAGTGLGVSGLLPTSDGHYTPITGEGGHVSLAAHDDWEASIVGRLRHRFGHASAERALSGPGLVNLYEAVCAVNGVTARMLSPSDVLDLAKRRADPHCQAALDLFCSFLGSVAGNLALTLGALGGVYIGGGIAPRIFDLLATSAFRERFQGKGRFQAYLEKIPTMVIDAVVSPALIGASRALDQKA